MSEFLSALGGIGKTLLRLNPTYSRYAIAEENREAEKLRRDEQRRYAEQEFNRQARINLRAEQYQRDDKAARQAAALSPDIAYTPKPFDIESIGRLPSAEATPAVNLGIGQQQQQQQILRPTAQIADDAMPPFAPLTGRETLRPQRPMPQGPGFTDLVVKDPITGMLTDRTQLAAQERPDLTNLAVDADFTRRAFGGKADPNLFDQETGRISQQTFDQTFVEPPSQQIGELPQVDVVPTNAQPPLQPTIQPEEVLQEELQPTPVDIPPGIGFDTPAGRIMPGPGAMPPMRGEVPPEIPTTAAAPMRPIPVAPAPSVVQPDVEPPPGQQTAIPQLGALANQSRLVMPTAAAEQAVAAPTPTPTPTPTPITPTQVTAPTQDNIKANIENGLTQVPGQRAKALGLIPMGDRTTDLTSVEIAQFDGLTGNPDAQRNFLRRKGFHVPYSIKELTDYAKLRQETHEAEFGPTTALRKEFDKATQNAEDIRDSIDRVFGAASDPSGAGDIALIFNFMKVLDPRSVVRESEYATAETAGSVDKRIWGLYNRILDGQRLSPPQRADFVKRAYILYQKKDVQFQRQLNRYTNIAKREGLDPELIVFDYSEGLSDDAAVLLKKPAWGHMVNLEENVQNYKRGENGEYLTNTATGWYIKDGEPKETSRWWMYVGGDRENDAAYVILDKLDGGKWQILDKNADGVFVARPNGILPALKEGETAKDKWSGLL